MAYRKLFNVGFLEIDFIGLPRERVYLLVKKGHLLRMSIVVATSATFAFFLLLKIEAGPALFICFVIEVILFLCFFAYIKKNAQDSAFLVTEALQGKTSKQILIDCERLLARSTKVEIDFYATIVIPPLAGLLSKNWTFLTASWIFLTASLILIPVTLKLCIHVSASLSIEFALINLEKELRRRAGKKIIPIKREYCFEADLKRHIENHLIDTLKSTSGLNFSRDYVVENILRKNPYLYELTELAMVASYLDENQPGVPDSFYHDVAADLVGRKWPICEARHAPAEKEEFLKKLEMVAREYVLLELDK